MGEDPAALPQPGDTINHKYRIERVLGSGGMSTVFEAKHRLTGRHFALKWLRPDMAAREDVLRRFVREAKIAGHVEHPNVVEVYDFGQAYGSFYIVMELLEGESLEQRLERAGRLTPDEARRVLLPCMRGVARAHAAGVIHRDIKTANIFLCKPTEERAELPKVLDFGISRFTGKDVKRDSPVTESGVWMGTPQYMSPEQVRGRPVDHRTDIYGFGVVLYELLAGVPAFDANTTSDLMVMIATEDPRPLAELVPGIDPALVAITMRAMARDRQARFPDLESMIAALQDGVAAPGPIASSTASPPVFAREPRGKRMAVALGAAALLGALAFGWLLLERKGAHEAAPAPAEPRELASAGAPAAPKARAATAGTATAGAPTAEGSADVSAKNPDAAAAADCSARPTGSPDTARHTRRKPQRAAAAEQAQPEQQEAARARRSQGQSGVSFDLKDFLPRGSSAARVQARERAPAPEGAGARREPN